MIVCRSSAIESSAGINEHDAEIAFRKKQSEFPAPAGGREPRPGFESMNGPHRATWAMERDNEASDHVLSPIVLLEPASSSR